MRFIVASVTGYGDSPGSRHPPASSFMVLDSHYNYREVRSFYASRCKKGDALRRRLAHEAAAQLEAEFGAAKDGP